MVGSCFLFPFFPRSFSTPLSHNPDRIAKAVKVFSATQLSQVPFAGIAVKPFFMQPSQRHVTRDKEAAKAS